MLTTNEPRCQGARGSFGSPVAAGSMPKDCCKCARRTDIIPGHSHTYQTPPTWMFWEECPRRVDPADVVDAEEGEQC